MLKQPPDTPAYARDHMHLLERTSPRAGCRASPKRLSKRTSELELQKDTASTPTAGVFSARATANVPDGRAIFRMDRGEVFPEMHVLWAYQNIDCSSHGMPKTEHSTQLHLRESPEAQVGAVLAERGLLGDSWMLDAVCFWALSINTLPCKPAHTRRIKHYN